MSTKTLLQELKAKREQFLCEERKRLLAFDDIAAAFELSREDQYSRMRFLREQEAIQWLNELRAAPSEIHFKSAVEYRATS